MSIRSAACVRVDRRTALALIVFTLLGAAVTLTVAWSATWLRGSWIRDFKVIDVRQVSGRPPSAGPVLAEVATNRLTTCVTAWSRLPEGSFPLYDSRTPGRAPWWVPDVLWCDPSTLDSATFRSGDRVAATRWEAAGWPLRAMRCATGNMYTPDGKGWMIGGERGGWLLWKKGWPIRLPLEPVWPGLLGDTLLYASLLFALWWSPSAIRRMARRHHGQCLNCGYDRRGHAASSPCPECGKYDESQQLATWSCADSGERS